MEKRIHASAISRVALGFRNHADTSFLAPGPWPLAPRVALRLRNHADAAVGLDDCRADFPHRRAAGRPQRRHQLVRTWTTIPRTMNSHQTTVVCHMRPSVAAASRIASDSAQPVGRGRRAAPTCPQRGGKRMKDARLQDARRQRRELAQRKNDTIRGDFPSAAGRTRYPAA